ncbi:MAG: carboxypeptidase-like regulatory domain-containing protein [Gemmatimonadales bacterium]|nr:carboxypeptidase-like regulatory domain-containing protein [Gemmatimonadales bacterium]MYL07740.1 carboxypeptidase-like regulatory domain-containing protein [Gemmatimonadales bacterium]
MTNMVSNLNPTRARAMAALMVVPLAVGAGSVEARQAQDCGDRALLRVLVADESGTVHAPGATVVLRWTAAERAPLREPAGADGRFHLCVPDDAREAILWAEFGDGSSEQAVVGFEPGATTAVELRILTGSAGTGRIIGQVNDGVTEDPVTAAAVSVSERTGTVETNGRGRFVLSGLPVGVQALHVRRPGYAPLRHVVAVHRGLTTEVEIGLVPTSAEMDPMVATATRPRQLEVTGFYERRLRGEMLGVGRFLTAEDIERWQPSTVGRFIEDHVPEIRRRGVTLINTTGLMGWKGCPVAIYVDGIPQRSYGIGGAVVPNQVAGLEVYTGPAGLPAEFRDERNRCGAVVAWTR